MKHYGSQNLLENLDDLEDLSATALIKFTQKED